MPIPTVEDVQFAVEKQLHAGLAGISGDWIAVLPGGSEIRFRPNPKGEIFVNFSDLAAMTEKSYKFRIRVELTPDSVPPEMCDCEVCEGEPDHEHNRISQWNPKWNTGKP